MTLTDHIVNLLMEVNDLEERPEMERRIKELAEKAKTLTMAEIDEIDDGDDAIMIFAIKAAELYARSKWQEACDAQLTLIARRFHDNIETQLRINSTPRPDFNP